MEAASIKILERITAEDFKSVCSTYTTTHRYQVTLNHSNDLSNISFCLDLVGLDPPVTITEWLPEDSDLFNYQKNLSQKLSFGYFNPELQGFILSEFQEWNSTLNVTNFCVEKSVRRNGIGKLLMEKLIQESKLRGISMIRCETQTINVPAIKFYLKQNFGFDGLELSFYRPDGLVQQDVALWMKYKN